ncbi:MAG: hypothetical protein HUJ80_06750, partial [Firmicutes bacterium]|nr:hypothetical protein [Bacillota bacterium]
NLELRGFIQSKGKQIISTQLGRELYRILPDELKKPDMTGLWWAEQQSIQEGQQPWTVLTDSVMDMIRKVIQTPYPSIDAYLVPEDMRRGKLPLGTCPRCGKPVIEGTRGFGCSGWKEGCSFTVWKRAKSGMMSHTDINASMVHQLLSGPWTDEYKPDDAGKLMPTGRKRTENTILIKRLYSESKKKIYPGMVYLTDEGEGSPFGAGFGLDSIPRLEPESLGKCPRCGKPVIEGKNAYGCSGYKDGCTFTIWKKAKAGMLQKQKITKGVVRTLLKSPWIDETKEENGQQVPTGRRRTEKLVHLRRLYSEAKNKYFEGDLYLADEGPESPYGAAFVLAGFSTEAPKPLGICPRCGKPVMESRLGFSCTGFPDCRFTIWKNSKQKLLANIEFTKTDAKKFLSAKPVRKRKLLDKKGQEFTAELMMIEEPDNPYGPVFRIVEGTISVKDADPSLIRTETVDGETAGAEYLRLRSQALERAAAASNEEPKGKDTDHAIQK